MVESESLSRHRLKKTLEVLASKEGRGTELISLYIPPDRQIHEVMANLREEHGTASNIKSRTTRKNVQDAIERVMQRLKLFKQPPPTGLVIFCGAIPQNGLGSERMETYVLVPPKPINVYFYRCDSRFHIEPLMELFREKETYGIIIIDVNEATLATLQGRRMEVIKELTSGIPGKHRAGGQSARRFERIREAAVNDYFKRVGGHANEIFSQITDLKGIIIGGPGPTKYDFEKGEYLNYMLKGKVIATLDTSYVGRTGLKEIVEKSGEILKGVRYAEEKKIVQRFLYEIGHDTGMATYGEGEVRRNLREGLVDTLLLTERLNLTYFKFNCKSCGYSEDRTLDHSEAVKIEGDTSQMQCPKCLNSTFTFDEKRDLQDMLIDEAEKSGINVELISTETEEGVMLKESFGGIAAILRYRKTGQQNQA
ncbi:peptide chain release factor aRF-1 [Candidatus Bathyarchaeota archaeon]|nr:peptide chain release factor aRF-1 [Candidatus Bathyarchaeota archaeon]